MKTRAAMQVEPDATPRSLQKFHPHLRDGPFVASWRCLACACMRALGRGMGADGLIRSTLQVGWSSARGGVLSVVNCVHDVVATHREGRSRLKWHAFNCWVTMVPGPMDPTATREGVQRFFEVLGQQQGAPTTHPDPQRTTPETQVPCVSPVFVTCSRRLYFRVRDGVGHQAGAVRRPGRGPHPLD